MSSDDFDEFEFDDDDLGPGGVVILVLAAIVYIALSPVVLAGYGCKKLYTWIKNKLFK